MNPALLLATVLLQLVTPGLVPASARRVMAEAPLHQLHAPAASPDGGRWRITPRPLSLNLLVATGGLLLILVELWWFLGVRRPGAAAAAGDDGVQTVTITVDGGYEPSRLRVQAGRPLRLAFHRIDPSSCVAQVLFPDFHRCLDLPLGETTVLELLPEKAGSYPFHCGMNMVRGVLEVVDGPEP